MTSRRGPFTYRLGPDLHVIGPDNQRLKIGDVHAGQEATVYYYQRDGRADGGPDRGAERSRREKGQVGGSLSSETDIPRVEAPARGFLLMGASAASQPRNDKEGRLQTIYFCKYIVAFLSAICSTTSGDHHGSAFSGSTIHRFPLISTP